jgi:hypothetical protein
MTETIPALVQAKPKVDDLREASALLFTLAQNELSLLIEAISVRPVNFIDVQAHLESFLSLQDNGVYALSHYANVADCEGSG